MGKENTIQFKGKYVASVGRRKEATARVRLYSGKGQVVINGKELNKYFTDNADQESLLAPIETLGQRKKFDISALVTGGGKSGQLGEIGRAHV